MGANDGAPCPRDALPLLPVAGTTPPGGEAPASEGDLRARGQVNQGNADLVAMTNLQPPRDRDATPPGRSEIPLTHTARRHPTNALGRVCLNLVTQPEGRWPQETDEADCVGLGGVTSVRQRERGRHEPGKNPSTRVQRAVLGSWIERGQQAALVAWTERGRR